MKNNISPTLSIGYWKGRPFINYDNFYYAIRESYGSDSAQKARDFIEKLLNMHDFKTEYIPSDPTNHFTPSGIYITPNEISPEGNYINIDRYNMMAELLLKGIEPYKLETSKAMTSFLTTMDFDTKKLPENGYVKLKLPDPIIDDLANSITTGKSIPNYNIHVQEHNAKTLLNLADFMVHNIQKDFGRDKASEVKRFIQRLLEKDCYKTENVSGIPGVYITKGNAPLNNDSVMVEKYNYMAHAIYTLMKAGIDIEVINNSKLLPIFLDKTKDKDKKIEKVRDLKTNKNDDFDSALKELNDTLDGLNKPEKKKSSIDNKNKSKKEDKGRF
ncbi:MAG: hypothetical protein J0H68_00470 [Sphingobacteriia bacterium]|nr:hypothetical protein [Sphingobacteriia bacterium]